MLKQLIIGHPLVIAHIYKMNNVIFMIISQGESLSQVITHSNCISAVSACISDISWESRVVGRGVRKIGG